MKAGYGGDNSKWDIGTLLQHAVDNHNRHLARILLEFGFVIAMTIKIEWIDHLSSCILI